MSNYTRLSARQINELLEQSRRFEEDLQHRFDLRLAIAESGGAELTAIPDPLAKRLKFLLAKKRVQRRDLELELGSRNRRDCGRSTDYSGGPTGSP